MLPRIRVALLAVAAVALLVAPLAAADLTTSLKSGTPDIKSAGPLAFGPDGVLFIGDTQGAAIFAIATGDTKAAGKGPIKVEGIDAKIAGLLGCTAQDIAINDLVVNPASGVAYLSVTRGKGPEAVPVVVKVDGSGKITEVPLKEIKFAKAVISNASTKSRQEAITDLAYVDGRVFVAGLSNEEFASRLRAIPFPFADADKGTGVEIYHGAHGRFETASPVRTFAYFKAASEDCLLAAYTCTPLVKFPIKDLKPGAQIRGTTVAELGNRNRPLDMIVYQKNGKNYLLLTNSSRGVMKISTENLEKNAGITEPVRGGGTAGQPYETISTLKGVEQLDKLDNENALLLVRAGGGSLNLETVALP